MAMVLLVRVGKVLNEGVYLQSLLALGGSLVFCFLSSRILWFYIFYELRLIPIRIIILR